MAIIKVGSIEDFSAKPKLKDRLKSVAYDALEAVEVLGGTTSPVQSADSGYFTSDSARGLALSSIKLMPGFEGRIMQFLRPQVGVYFIAWSWDFSGKLPVQYPGEGASPQDCVLQLRIGEVRQFLGDGTILFPSRPVTGGLGVRIQLWQSHEEIRNFSDTLTQISNVVKSSEFSSLLLSFATANPGASAVDGAATNLVQAIGAICKAKGDGFVDFFEGYWQAAEPWNTGPQTYNHAKCEIVLNLLAQPPPPSQQIVATA